MRSKRTILTLVAALAAPLAGCNKTPAGPSQLNTDQLTFLRAADNAPPLATLQAQVWARFGDTRHVPINYQAVDGYSDECMDFIIPAGALWKKPDGTPFQPGDSVLIKVTVVNPKQFNFRFEPSGLQFNPDHPAELRVSYKWANPDYNGDGVVDRRDVTYTFGFWRQEADSAPWTRISTSRDRNLQEIDANILGFSKYAMAGA